MLIDDFCVHRYFNLRMIPPTRGDHGEITENVIEISVPHTGLRGVQPSEVVVGTFGFLSKVEDQDMQLVIGGHDI